MTTLAYLLGILFVVLGVGLSIGLHELGHLVPAKRFGVKVTQYMVGFGPTVWSRRRGDTEYGLKAIPLGGYCRMIGMYPPAPGEDPTRVRVSSTGRFSQLADEARKAAYEEIGPGDEHRVFYRLSVPRKVAVMLGGPLMNLVLAVVLLAGLVMAYGLPVDKPGASVAAVYECVVKATPGAQVPKTCPAGTPKTPAYLAGLKPDDTIVSIAGQPVRTPDDVSRLVGPRTGKATSVVVRRAGSERTLTVTPIVNSLPVYDDAGKVTHNADGSVTYHDTGYLGISSSQFSVIERQSPAVVPGLVWDQSVSTAGLILNLPSRMVAVANAAFGSGQREADGPISVVGVGRIAGEISSGTLGLRDNSIGAKLALLVQLLVGLNLALFVFNLVPLLPLDGGHVIGALWEGVKRRIARLRGQTGPVYVDVAKAMPIAYVVGLGLLVMSALLIYADLVHPINLGG